MCVSDGATGSDGGRVMAGESDPARSCECQTRAPGPQRTGRGSALRGPGESFKKRTHFLCALIIPSTDVG